MRACSRCVFGAPCLSYLCALVARSVRVPGPSGPGAVVRAVCSVLCVVVTVRACSRCVLGAPCLSYSCAVVRVRVRDCSRGVLGASCLSYLCAIVRSLGCGVCLVLGVLVTSMPLCAL